MIALTWGNRWLGDYGLVYGLMLVGVVVWVLVMWLDSQRRAK